MTDRVVYDVRFFLKPPRRGHTPDLTGADTVKAVYAIETMVDPLPELARIWDAYGVPFTARYPRQLLGDNQGLRSGLRRRMRNLIRAGDQGAINMAIVSGYPVEQIKKEEDPTP